MSWISQVLATTKESESPRVYWYWAALTAISGVVNNHVWLDKYYYKLFPNIYVILVGRSGIRKNNPVDLARDLIRTVNNTRVIFGRTSIQAAITDIKNSFTPADGGPPLTEPVATLITGELAAFIIEDPAALTILTDLYGCPTDWSNRTKGGGKETLVGKACITMMGASNEVHLRNVIPDDAIGGGFVGRTFMIHADKKAGSNPLTNKPEIVPDLYELAKYLKRIARVKGGFVYSKDGKDLYEQWYAKFEAVQSEYGGDTTGTMERLHDSILKTAMLISLARSPDLILEKEDIHEAIMACQAFVPGARKIALGSGGPSQSAPGTAAFIRALLARGEEGNYSQTRTKMAQENWHYFDTFEMDKIAESLKIANVIEEIVDRDEYMKVVVVWKLKEAIINRYRTKGTGDGTVQMKPEAS